MIPPVNQYSALIVWIDDNIPLLIFLFTGLLGAVVKLGFMLWKTHKETEQSAMERVAKSVEDLVIRIDNLFAKHDAHDARIGKLEKRIGEHFVRCNERERLVLDIKDKQDRAIKKYDDHILKREHDVVINDRCDREN